MSAVNHKHEGYKDWIIPLSEEKLTLDQAYSSLQNVGADQKEVPLIVRLVENPAFRLPGFTLFHGAVDLIKHDYIHILLGRGLLPTDESFVIGFTMGSTGKVSQVETDLFSLVSRHLYPQNYRFRKRELTVFKNAVKLAEIMYCVALDNVDYTCLMNTDIESIREQLLIDTDMLKASYRIEQRLFPDNLASQRLLKTD